MYTKPFSGMIRSAGRGWSRRLLFATTLAALPLIAVATGSETDVATIMPPLVRAPVSMPVRSVGQTQALDSRGAAYSAAALPAVTAEFAQFRQQQRSLGFRTAVSLGKLRDPAQFACAGIWTMLTMVSAC
ncbi:hypothetical protein ACPPVV_18510 [Rhodanobacter sp. Col0626]|uniref:hypothetical protein n=1 Tax=Rhodanobacter sp. Col0626 TaxID=3415679 RepID=UPI003CEC770A